MKELSLHILDIVENSINANANLIELTLFEDTKLDILYIELIDDGCGMSEEVLKRVCNPFYTTRTTRRVGLGIPLLKENAERCEGNFEIYSEEGKGTRVKVSFKHSNIDRPPLGNISDTIIALISNANYSDMYFKHIYNDNSYTIDTREIKTTLEVDKLQETDVLMWIKEYIEENEKEILL